MRRPQDGKGMDPPPAYTARGESSASRGTPPRMRPRAPPGLIAPDGSIGIAISKPMPVAQWQPPQPRTTVWPTDGYASTSYQPPAGPSQAPKRPPRPSQVPSILDNSRIQDHTPVFQYSARDSRPSESSGRDSSVSSVGSIPEFPMPGRRSATLGPPPSARRGASSFYSAQAYVPPIPEETHRLGSTTSFASSAAMPTSYGGRSSVSSAQSMDFFDELIAEGDAGGARPDGDHETFGEGTGYIDRSEGSSSSGQSGKSGKSGISTTIRPIGAAMTTDKMLAAFEAAGANDPSAARNATSSPRPFSLFRRPPPLNMEAVRVAEARGSLTSLSGLIKRATRLAVLIDKGRRPGSRLDGLDSQDESDDDPFSAHMMQSTGRWHADDGPADWDSGDLEKHQSGLTDMLNAFPPPARETAGQMAGERSGRTAGPSMRDNLRESWPLTLLGRRSPRPPMPPPAAVVPTTVVEQSNQVSHFSGLGSDVKEERRQKQLQQPRSGGLVTGGGIEYASSQAGQDQQANKGRRCCGLSMTGFILVMLLLLGIVAVAIAVPLKLFLKKEKLEELAQCRTQVTCANGGTNVVTQGVCSCICTNGFTGANCTVAGSAGCVRTSFVSSEGNLTDVTIGQAIPRLILDAPSNFSIGLSPATIVSKFNAANFSCNTQDALVTFNGRSTRAGIGKMNALLIPLSVPDIQLTLTLNDPLQTGDVVTSTLSFPGVSGGFSTIFQTTVTVTTTSAPAEATPRPTGATGNGAPPTITPSPTSPPSGTFIVDEQSIDFARVAVLLVMQRQGLNEAAEAQRRLQAFITAAGAGASTAVTTAQARSVNIGGSSTVDFVNVVVHV